jgi:hypothetical protein
MPVTLASEKAEIWRILVPGQPRQKSLQDTLSMEKMGVVLSTYHPRYSRSINGRQDPLRTQIREELITKFIWGSRGLCGGGHS